MKMKERFCELTAREIAIAEAVLSVLKAEPLQCGEAAMPSFEPTPPGGDGAPEIEVTPEMIEAGRKVLCESGVIDFGVNGSSLGCSVAVEIYRAMRVLENPPHTCIPALNHNVADCDLRSGVHNLQNGVAELYRG